MLLTAPVLWGMQTTQILLSLLLSGKTSTLREVYYMDRRLYEDQTKSNKSIELLARCLNVHRATLNIFSRSKGCLCGAFRLKVKEGSWQDCSNSTIMT